MDWDADGTPDFISGSYDPGDLYLFRGLGQGRYAKVETLCDETGTALVHHPEEFNAYHEMRGDPDADPEASIQARVASFGSWPAPVDWDADGDLDLLIGSFSGKLYLRRNVGTRAEPKFDAESVQVPGVSVHGHFDPVPADWDGDGLWDLVAGSADGSVSWFPNVGTAEAPSFGPKRTLVEARSENKFLSQHLMPGEAPEPGVRAQICVTDYDGDGDLDLIVGDYSDVYLDPASLEGERKAELERLDAAIAAASDDDERYQLSNDRGELLEHRRHSAVWLYRRAGSGAAAQEAAVAQPVDVPVEEPSEAAPVKAGLALSAKSLAVGDVFDVVVRVRVAPRWHVYDLEKKGPYANTELELELPEGLTAVGEWQRPASIPYPLAGSGARIWKRDVRFRHALRVDALPPAGAEIACTVAYQACNADFCRPPEREELAAALPAAGQPSERSDEEAWAPHRETRVLYAGYPDGHRERVFAGFLAEWFDQTATIPLGALSVETAEDYDVVIVDWVSWYGCDGYPPPEEARRLTVPTMLGADFTKPVIAMTYVGTRVRAPYKLDWL